MAMAIPRIYRRNVISAGRSIISTSRSLPPSFAARLAGLFLFGKPSRYIHPSFAAGLDRKRHFTDCDRNAPYLGRALLQRLIPSPRRKRSEQFILVVNQGDNISLFHEISAIRPIAAGFRFQLKSRTTPAGLLPPSLAPTWKG
jgi:hypothetical protein